MFTSEWLTCYVFLSYGTYPPSIAPLVPHVVCAFTAYCLFYLVYLCLLGLYSLCLCFYQCCIVCNKSIWIWIIEREREREGERETWEKHMSARAHTWNTCRQTVCESLVRSKKNGVDMDSLTDWTTRKHRLFQQRTLLLSNSDRL